MHLPSIAERGLLPRSYWSNDAELASYYRETVEDDGESSVLLAVDLCHLDAAFLLPDLPGIEEPITTVIAFWSAEEVWETWSRSGRTWQDSLAIVHSLCYDRAIPAARLRVATKNGWRPLVDCL
jgi:hypothetical protein